MATMATGDSKELISALEANWQAEMEGWHTYTALSKDEPDAHRRNAEKHHADLWLERIKALGGTEPHYDGKPDSQVWERSTSTTHLANQLSEDYV